MITVSEHKTHSAPAKQVPLFVQAQLTINQPGDQYEQEADRVADTVMRMPAGPDHFFPTQSITPIVQRKCSSCEKEELQRKEEDEGELVQMKSLEGLVQRDLDDGVGEAADEERDRFRRRLRRDLGRATDRAIAQARCRREVSTFRKIRGECPEETGVRLIDVLDRLRARMMGNSRCVEFFQTHFQISPDIMFSHTAPPSVGISPAIDTVSGNTMCAEPNCRFLPIRPAIALNPDMCRSPLLMRVLVHEFTHYATCYHHPADTGLEGLPEQASTICIGTVLEALEEARAARAASPGPAPVRRKCEACAEEATVQKKPVDQPTPVQPAFSNYIASIGGGSSLSSGDRQFFSSRMGYDFSGVQIHTGTSASASAKMIQAKAYTYRNNIVFNEGRYQPGTESGRRLLAHELTHVVQQSGMVQRQPSRTRAAAPPTGMGITTEEALLYTRQTNIAGFLGPLARPLRRFRRALTRAARFADAQTVAHQHGRRLWNAATTTARPRPYTDTSTDDRPLYWSRLDALDFIRTYTPSFAITAPQRQQLVDAFETSSRGLNSVLFSRSAHEPEIKKVLISGFDPFGVLGGMPAGGRVDQTLLDSNASGAAILALDGTIITHSSGLQAEIEGVVIPVRFRDFDAGLIESFFRPFLDGSRPVNMIMTISQGETNFDIEQWASHHRITNTDDNEGQLGAPLGSPTFVNIPGASLSPAADLETGLQNLGMESAGARLHSDPGRAMDPRIGSGGNFLSNEIFYRVRALQESLIRSGAISSRIPAGHLHVPTEDVMNRAAIVARIRSIIEAAIPNI